MKTLEITLPVPHKSLSPNARCHPHGEGETSAYRKAAMLSGIAADPEPKRHTLATVEIDWFTKTLPAS